jgi:hypothetical protein
MHVRLFAQPKVKISLEENFNGKKLKQGNLELGDGAVPIVVGE